MCYIRNGLNFSVYSTYFKTGTVFARLKMFILAFCFIRIRRKL